MQKEIVEYTDDVDGEPIDVGFAQTFRFTVDGVVYEIDLRPAHAEKFREGMARLIAAARPVGLRQDRHRRRAGTAPAASPARAAAKRPVTGRDRYQLAAVRAWAKGQGIAVSARGRVPGCVLEQFDAAHTP